MSNGQNVTKFYLFIFSAQDLIVHGVLMNFLIDTVSPTKAIKNKNMIKEIKISSNNGKCNNKNNLWWFWISKDILKKIKSLILYIKINNSECRIISQPVQRTDNGKEDDAHIK